MISETSVAETSTPYSSRTISWMSRVVIPLAYRRENLLVEAGHAPLMLATISCGSKRAVAIARRVERHFAQIALHRLRDYARCGDWAGLVLLG